MVIDNKENSINTTCVYDMVEHRNADHIDGLKENLKFTDGERRNHIARFNGMLISQLGKP